MNGPLSNLSARPDPSKKPVNLSIGGGTPSISDVLGRLVGRFDGSLVYDLAVPDDSYIS